MDAVQFAAFMKAQENLVKQISLLNVGVSSSNTAQSNNFNTALVPNFEAFDAGKETFRNYIQRFTNYINMKNVHGDKEYFTKLLLL